MSAIESVGSSVWGYGVNSEPQLTNPFLDYASLAMPSNNPSALRWVEFLFLSDGLYREAARRMVTYFITRPLFTGVSTEVKELWTKFYTETIDYYSLLHLIGLDNCCYGNSFTSVIPLYIRHLMCGNQQCRAFKAPLSVIRRNNTFDFKWQDYKFMMTCPTCKVRAAGVVADHEVGQTNGFRIRRWNPHEIEIIVDPWTGQKNFIWKIPESYQQDIREGRELAIENAPIQVIEAVKNNNYLKFDSRFILHLTEDALAGVNNHGWGISRVLTNFRQSWRLQVYQRYNEAIALDYIVPFRLITPELGDKTSGGDVLTNTNAGEFMSRVHGMIRRRRFNPTSWFSLPFPVKYQSLGGDAKALAPVELIKQAQETQLNNIGIPADMFQGSMTMQAAPVGLRLFQASQASIPHAFNMLLRFVMTRVSTMLRWPSADVMLEQVQHADDINRQMAKLNLMSQGLVSPSSGLKSVGVEYVDELRQMADDQEAQAKSQAELQERMDRNAQMRDMAQGGGMSGQAPPGGDPNAGGGAPPGGGQPQGGQPGMPGQSILAGMPQGPNQKVSPEEQSERADTIIQELAMKPDGQRQSELIQLKKVDPNLHAIVTSRKKDMDQRARTQGKDIVMAQTFGKQGSERAARILADADRVLRRLRSLRGGRRTAE